jgi:arylsulfatase A-like enzyme
MTNHTRPNILLIVADDMGYGDFGVFNDGPARTPCLDALVDQSICLTQHYAGSPACSPSRAALLTGRYPHRTGALTPQEMLGLDRIALDERTIADAFKAGGYKTGLIGKWHNGALDPRYHPNQRGFDEFFGFRGGWMDYYDWWVERNERVEKSDGRYLTDVFTQEAVDFMDRHQKDPFFLMLAYNAPHSPLQAPDKISKPYLESGLVPGTGITYAMNEVMDQGLGRLLETLDKLGLDDNTVVMFTSDNGPAFRLRPDQVPPGMDTATPRYNCGFNGQKGSVYEGGIRVPMVLRWPAGLDSSLRVDELVHFTDWLPTLLGLSGLDLPTDGRSLDGRDVLPILRGEKAQDPPRRFWQLNAYQPLGTVNAAMRDGDWKLVRPQVPLKPVGPEDKRLMARYIELDIEYKYHPENITQLMDDPDPEMTFEAATPELYDIAADPLEKDNLADQEPARLSRMQGELDAWFEEVEHERSRIPPF